MIRSSQIGAFFAVAVLGSAAAAQSQNVAPPVPRAAAETLDDAITAAVRAADSERRGGVFAEALAAMPAGDRDAIEAFYAARGHAPFWSEAGNLEALEAAFAEAPRHGLPEGRYRHAGLDAVFSGADGIRADLATMAAYLRYGRDMTGGLVDPRRVDDEINVTPARLDAAALLERLERGPVAEALASLAPARPEYAALIAEKERLEEVARSRGWGEPVPDGPMVRLGDTGARVLALRERLAARGYASGGAGAGTTFDVTLESAVKAFQRDNGLVDDGLPGRQTMALLNASPEDRIGQILVNLERMRWLPETMGERYVWVNIPDYTVSVFEDGAQVYHTRSIVGEGRTRTPEFSDRMTYLVVNPTWYIPDSIAKRVYLPQLRQDPAVLARNNMRLFTRAGTEIDPGLVDFASLGDSFPFRVRQNPSASNALGRVKFMFPNQFAIYLHDTPNRELFDRDGRAFSNGCVRLAKPFELAHYLLEPQLSDPEGQFQAWVDAGSERYVTLERPIDVHLVYRTAWADEAGVHFRHDVYGRDAKVLAALEEAGVTAAAARVEVSAPGSAG